MHAYPLDSHIPILSAVRLPDGVQVITVTCADYDALKTLPRAITYDGSPLGRSGWDSDRCVAFYRSDVRMAEITRS